jgi:molybdenum cofactor synthesis domain-containing protein
MSSQPTAAIVVIGNEILSGKTQDANIRFLGSALAEAGVVLAEAIVVRDDHETIAKTVRYYSERHTYVFTTGGIGPTHDDITAEAVAAAFGATLELNEEAAELIGGDREHPRMKMAMMPPEATLIENTATRAPGFRLENVFVLAGIPRIAQAMFEAIRPTLEGGSAIVSANADVYLRESDIAAPLTDIVDANPDVEIGSYPFIRDKGYGANLVVRGTNMERVDAVMETIVATMRELGGDVSRNA